MKKFQQIFFDLDGTIFDFQRCEIHALDKTFNNFSINFDENILRRYMNINAELWEKHESGGITQTELLIYRFEVLFKEIGINMSSKLISEEYQRCLSSMCFFEKDALNVLQKLYKKYNLYIMTNGNLDTQIRRIKKAKISKYFKDIFVSEDIGYHKPQVEFFEICFQKIGMENKNSCMIIGDSLSSDIMGGNNVGIKTCWYNPRKEKNMKAISYNYEINSLMQIFNIL